MMRQWRLAGCAEGSLVPCCNAEDEGASAMGVVPWHRIARRRFQETGCRLRRMRFLSSLVARTMQAETSNLDRRKAIR
jgi:hypothetical protein